MPSNAYPNLGFDPCPGLPEDVAALSSRVSKAADSMQQANELMARLRSDSSGVWQGDAGEAFRSHLNSKLIDGLGKANQSLNKAVTTLQGWVPQLGGLKERADALEQQAAQAQQRLSAARDQAARAANNPDLGLAGRTFGDPAALQDAQRRLDQAALALRRAREGADAAEEALERVRKLARDLYDEWDDASNKVAAKLREAAKFAPDVPGLLSRIGNGIADGVSAVGDWVGDHLDEIHTALSTVSAVAGLLALCTPPPIDAVALGVSLVAGAGALGITLADPKIRGDLGEVLHGNFSGNWGSLGRLGGDALGLVPGIGLAKGAFKGADAIAVGTEEMPKIVGIASKVAHDPGLVMKTVERFVPAGADSHLGGLVDQVPNVVREGTAGAAHALNFANKVRGAVQKTGSTAWDYVNGD